MEKKELIKAAKELIECCDSVYMSTFNKEYESAETRAMANLRSKDYYPSNLELFTEEDLSNFIITAISSEKIKQIKENKNISLYYYCSDIKKSLTLFGTTEFIYDDETKEKLWVDEWAQYFKLGHEDPEYAVIKFIPKVAKYYTDDYTKVMVEL